MVTTLENADGLVYAWIEWSVVDETGTKNKAGHYMYVNNIWIHNWAKKSDTLGKLVCKVNEDEKMKDVIAVYWKNRKHDRTIDLKDRERLVKMAKGGMKCLI